MNQIVINDISKFDSIVNKHASSSSQPLFLYFVGSNVEE